jgi:hypothetical protein
MEARSAIRGSGISKSFVAVCAVVATMGLGVTAGVVAKNLSAPAGVPAHVVQGQGGALQYSGHRGGVQAINETLAPAYQQVDTRGVKAAPAAVGPDDRPTTTKLAPNSFLGPDAQERNSQLAGSMLASEEFGLTAGAAAQLAPNSFLGPDAQERNSQLAASMRVLKAHGYI